MRFSILPPPGQRKIATSWVASLLVCGLYVHAVAYGADPGDALETAVDAIVWVVGLVFGANATVHGARALKGVEDDDPQRSAGPRADSRRADPPA